MIRYIKLDIGGILMFIFLLVESASTEPPLSLLLWLGIGVLLSIPISFFVLPKVKDKLIQDHSSFLDRRPPSGVWFFISIGAIGGLIALIIELIGREQSLHELLIVCLSVLICCFTAIGTLVLILERRYKKQAYLRMPDGLVFLDQESD